jgi:hypothetical protein
MTTAKERYSQDKKAYDNRTPEEIQAANAAAAAAAAVRLVNTLHPHRVDALIR